MSRFSMTIGGEAVFGDATTPVVNPALGPLLDQEHVVVGQPVPPLLAPVVSECVTSEQTTQADLPVGGGIACAD